MKKPTALLLSLMIASTFTACAGKDTAKPEDSGASQGGETASSEAAEIPDSSDDNSEAAEDTADEVMKRFGYKGTFDDEVFDKFVSSIVIGDIEVSYPCTLNDFIKNENYEYEEFWGKLKYKGYEAADIYIYPPDEDDDIYDNPFDYMRIIKSDINIAKVYNIDLILSIGGIRIGDNSEIIHEYFGEPTRYSDYDTHFFYIYKTDNHMIAFHFNKDDDSLSSMIVSFTLGESEEE